MARANIFSIQVDTTQDIIVNRSMQLLICLFTISTSEKLELVVKEEAQAITNVFLQFLTILSAIISLRIFEETVPSSEYLETKGLFICYGR